MTERNRSRPLLLTAMTLAILAPGLAAQPSPDDWASLQRYRRANAELPPPAVGERRVVFMGNSITAAWAPMFPALFPGKPYIGRGISGQTTPQMLVRFRQDVIALKPAVVVILGGTNDIAGNTGPSTLEPAPKIVALNAWVRAYAASHGHAYADFHGAMADARQGLPPELASDGVHPTEAGYRVMGRLVERAIAEALNRRRHRPQ